MWKVGSPLALPELAAVNFPGECKHGSCPPPRVEGAGRLARPPNPHPSSHLIFTPRLLSHPVANQPIPTTNADTTRYTVTSIARSYPTTTQTTHPPPQPFRKKKYSRLTASLLYFHVHHPFCRPLIFPPERSISQPVPRDPILFYRRGLTVTMYKLSWLMTDVDLPPY